MDSWDPGSNWSGDEMKPEKFQWVATTVYFCCPKMIVCILFPFLLQVFFLKRICPACACFWVAFAGCFRVTAMNPSEENDFSGWQMPFPFELPWHFAEIGGDGWAQKDGSKKLQDQFTTKYKRVPKLKIPALPNLLHFHRWRSWWFSLWWAVHPCDDNNPDHSWDGRLP